MLPDMFFYIFVFLYGIVIGSFLNVLIIRLPEGGDIVKESSHCMKCGHQLKWFELIPVFSWLFLGGKCRICKSKISVQYPLIEGLNGLLYLFIVYKCGFTVESLLYCLLFSALITISVIDFRTFEIPVGLNYFIFALGIGRVFTDLSNWPDYLIGFLSVSAFLYLIYVLTKGRGLGGGDIKLMAVCGLLLGWERIVLAFLLGCIIGSVCHVTRMKISKVDHVLALGPYLSIGVGISALWGWDLIYWYLNLLGI